jgi:chromosome segregation ATPase
MCRKVGIGVVAVTLTLGALWTLGAITFGAHKTNSLISCTWNKFQMDANNQVPVEVEIDRIKHEIAQLYNDQKQTMSTIAEETVAVRKLHQETGEIRANLDKQKRDLLAASKQLEERTFPVVYGDREYSNPDHARDKVARELAIYKRNALELKAKEDLLKAREHNLHAAKEQLGSIKDQKRELEVRVAQLEAEYKSLQVAQTKSKFQFNDARLSGIKKSLDELETRVRVEEEKLKLYEDFSTEGKPVATPRTNSTSKNIAQEVREYFGETNGAIAERE